ncbi:MAG: rhodanese-like domain-containing protein [Bacteroidota bacterium]
MEIGIFFNKDFFPSQIFTNFGIIKINHKMNLNQEDWVNQLNQDSNIIILDVRTEEECNEGIIPNAIQLDIRKSNEFLSAIQEFDKTKNYYVYCRSGARSEQACSVMNQLGIINAYNLLGGMMQWQGEVTIPE